MLEPSGAYVCTIELLGPVGPGPAATGLSCQLLWLWLPGLSAVPAPSRQASGKEAGGSLASHLMGLPSALACFCS